MNRVTVTVSGAAGTGKSAICGEIEILCKALGLDVRWSNGKEEKGLTHADWTTALEMYRPTVEIIEVIEKTAAARAASANETGAEGAKDLAERAHLAAGAWADANTPIAEALAFRDGFIAGANSSALVPCPICGGEAVGHIDMLERVTIAPEPRAAVTEAARDVLAERRRQVEAEGWTPAHDDEHDECEMALAAIVYAESAVGYHPSCPDTWPWSPKWFKPTTPRRDLVKAAALVIAEIERLDRATARTGASS